MFVFYLGPMLLPTHLPLEVATPYAPIRVHFVASYSYGFYITFALARLVATDILTHLLDISVPCFSPFHTHILLSRAHFLRTQPLLPTFISGSQFPVYLDVIALFYISMLSIYSFHVRSPFHPSFSVSSYSLTLYYSRSTGTFTFSFPYSHFLFFI